MKDIIFTDTATTELRKEFDLVPGYNPVADRPELMPNNYRYEGKVILSFTSSGDFSDMSLIDVEQLVMDKLLKSGLLK